MRGIDTPANDSHSRVSPERGTGSRPFRGRGQVRPCTVRHGRRVLRRLGLALAISAILSSSGAFALGIGAIKTHSFLNQTFKAEISLVAVARGELDDVKVELAPARDFEKAGVDRPYYLSKLRFHPKRLADGRAIVEVTSSEPIREPYLDFLVEVTWPKGRLLREFTVLLDPPVTLERPAPSVTAPVARGGPVATPGASAADAGTDFPIEYGPTRRNDTLWGIARGLTVPGASLEQVAMALFRNNPNAFIGNNINRLKIGEVLRIPSREVLLELDRRQARAEFFAEANNRGRSQQAPGPSAVGEEPLSGAQLKIASAPQAGETRPAVAEGAADEGSAIASLRNDLFLVREANESTRQDNQELRSRIRELEAQLADIRGLMALKSNELAQLQGRGQEPGRTLGEEEGASGATAGEQPLPGTIEASAGTETAVSPGSETAVEPGVEESPGGLAESERTTAETGSTLKGAGPSSEETTEETPEQATPTGPEAVEPVPGSEPPLVGAAAESGADTSKAPPATAPVADREAKPTGGFSSDTLMMGIAATVVIILFSLSWLLMRRRREADEDFQESMLTTPTDDKQPAAEKATARNLPEASDETSFISDFAPGDIDALSGDDSSEVDPVAEADVYIAYGRYQQAEDLIQKAIEKKPERLDLKYKLLELYFTTRNVAAFMELSERMQEQGADRQDQAQWERVTSMGRELAPNSPLFAITAAASNVDRLADVDAEASSLGQEPPMSATADGGSEPLDLDFNLDVASDTPHSESTEMAPDVSMDIDLADLEKVAEPDRLQATETPVLDIPETTTAAAGSDLEIDLDDLDALKDVDLSDLGGVETAQPAGSDFSASSRDPRHDVEVPSIGLEDLQLEDTDTSEIGSDLGSDIVASDEGEDVGMKLDLARAYIEMEDQEGARGLLEEVLNEGDAEQKAEAGKLMQQLG